VIAILQLKSLKITLSTLLVHYIIYCGVAYYLRLEQNSYPMKEWHVKHMENTLVKFVTGLSEDASRWERRINKKYGKIGRVAKRIEYDIKHGVTIKQVSSFLQLIRTGPAFSEVRTHNGSMERLNEIHAYFMASDSEEEYPKSQDMWNQRTFKLLVSKQPLT
jgi:hypothetical protein